MNEAFNFNEAEKELLAGKKISGKDSILAPLVKQLVEAAVETEVESHIADEVLKGNQNRRNGYNNKQIKSSNGEFELSTPRDREATFEPQIVKKHQTTISDEIKEKILSMYGLGMSYSNITKHIEDIYRISLSTATISSLPIRSSPDSKNTSNVHTKGYIASYGSMRSITKSKRTACMYPKPFTPSSVFDWTVKKR